MAWKKREGKHAWRSYLTKAEAAEVDQIERAAQEIDADRRALTQRRNLIVNRAIQRSRYAEAKP